MQHPSLTVTELKGKKYVLQIEKKSIHCHKEWICFLFVCTFSRIIDDQVTFKNGGKLFLSDKQEMFYIYFASRILKNNNLFK